MTVALYCRVSTDEQAQHGHSIDAQQERLLAYCKSQGWDEYRLYIDDGYSGTSMDRPALKSLLRHVEQKLIDTVIVYRLDRMSRRQKDVLFLLEDVFEPNGVIFKSATEPFDTGTPLGKAMIGILAVFAQLERDTIVERTREGKRKRVQKGMWQGGRVAFGYIHDTTTGKLIVNEDEARLVRAVYRRFINGATLTELGDWMSMYDNSRNWNFVTVRQLIDRPTYLGSITWGEHHVGGTHEPIIDKETYRLAQFERERRKQTSPSRQKYLLTGLLRCGECGSRMFHRIYGNGKYRYEYYACEVTENSVKYLERRGINKTCHLPKIRQAKAEQYVMEHLRQAAGLRQEELTHFIGAIPDDHNEADDLMSKLKGRIEELDRRIDRWYEAFERGEIDSKRATTRVRELEAERQQLLSELNETPMPERAEGVRQEFYDAMSLIDEAWDTLTEEERREVMANAIKEIRVDPDHSIHITWNT